MKLESALCLLIIAISLSTIDCAVVPVVYEKIEICVDDDNRAGFIDFSDFKIHIENDTHAFANGTWKFLKDVKSPWKYTTISERNTRGQWVIEALHRTVPDLCTEMHNVMQPWYFFFKHVPKCPRLAGSEWYFNMVHLILPFYVPTNYLGKWRYTQISEFVINNVVKSECIRVYADLYDE